MAFEVRKYGDIFDAMRAHSAATSAITDFEVGSVTRTLTESFAYEIALLYEKMRLVYLSAFVDTAEGQQLDMLVAALGIARGEPDFAQGVVTFQRDTTNQDTEIPVGTLVSTEDKPGAPKKVFQTVDRATLPAGQTSIDVRVQALDRGETQTAPAGTLVVMPRPIPGVKSTTNVNAITFTGKKGETDEQLRERAKSTLISSGKATLVAIENALLSLPEVADVRVIEHFDDSQFGLIDVYVDGVDLSDASKKAELTGAIDRVRAAGVFARLQATTTLKIDGVFQIEVKPDLKLAPDERAALENKVAASIASYVDTLKMGDSFRLSQVISSILAVEGVTDLVKYAISVNGTPAFQDTNRTLESKPSERFKVALLCVASEVKALPIDLEFKAVAGLTPASLAAATTALQAQFVGLAMGAVVQGADLVAPLTAAGITIDASTLEVTPHSWCGEVTRNGNDIAPRFIEKPSLGEVFAYSSLLKVTGALRLTLSPKLTDAQKTGIQSQVRQKVVDLLASLKSGEDIVFDDIVAGAKSVPQVQDAQINTNDFRVMLDDATTETAGRISDKKLDVQTFEKAVLESFCVTGSIRPVAVTVSKVSVTAVVPGNTPTGAQLTDQQNQVKTAIAGKPLLTGIAAGQNVDYNSVKSAIEALGAGFSVTVTSITVASVSQCDSRSQTATAPGARILIRSVEVAMLTPIDAAAIAVTVHGSQTP